MKNSVVLLVLMLVIPAFIQAQQVIYLDYDNNNCMSRYEYKTSSSFINNYIAYHVYKSQTERVILELGAENQKNQSYKPSNTIPCSQFTPTEEIVKKINSGSTDVYIVKKTNGQYNVSKVMLASYHSRKGEMLRYVSYDCEFTYDFNSFPGTTDLSITNNVEVYYQGESEEGCKRQYHFKKIPELTCKPYTKLTYVEDVGMVKEEIGLNDTHAGQNAMTLIKVNNNALNDYITEKCTSGKILEDIVVVKEKEVSPPPTSYSLVPSTPPSSPSSEPAPPPAVRIAPAEDLVSRGNPSNSGTPQTKVVCSKKSSKGIHIVQQSETLYSIARRSGITLDQLRVWNDISQNNDLIYPCTALNILPPAFYEKGANTGRLINTSPTRKSPNGIHVVEDGETLIAIAKSYGFTTQKLREMNDLHSDKLFVGQELKVNDCLCEVTKRTSPIPKEYDLTIKGSPIPSGNQIVHEVQPKETLYSISKKYNVKIEKLLQLNQLSDPSKIQMFQKLIISE